jgi:hypothetical protein
MENLEENSKFYAERKVGKSRDASKKQKLQRTQRLIARLRDTTWGHKAAAPAAIFFGFGRRE